MQGKYHGLFLLTFLYIRRPHVAVHDWDFPSTQKQWIRWPKLSLPADVLWGSFVTHSFLLFPFGVRFTHINSPWLADHDTITNRILAYSNNPERKCRLFLADVILGDPGAVSRAGRKGATKVFKHRRKSPWVPTLTGPFPNGQVNAGSWLGTKNALYYCAQSGNSISWVLFVSSYTTRQLLTRSRLVWLMHQTNARSQETFIWYKHFISKYWLSLH